MPSDHPLASLATDLLVDLRALKLHFPDLEPSALAAAVQALLAFGQERQLLGEEPPQPTARVQGAAGELLLRQLQSAADAAASRADATTAQHAPRDLTRGADRRPGQLRFFHPCIHVASDLSYYSFAAPYERTVRARTRTTVGLTCVDSRGQTFPTVQIARHLRQRIAGIERAAAHGAELMSDPPDVLLSEQGLAAALDRLRADFPADLPFRSALHQRRLRVWCLMTYLYPLVPSTPFLRVRVPDVRSARSVQQLLEACCFNALGCSGSAATAVRRHRSTFAGAVVFSPEVRTGRLPRAALDLLEAPPRRRRHEPPVAFVELQGDFAAPRVPEEWVVDVELVGMVRSLELAEDHRHLGCAVALSRGGQLIARAPQEGSAAELAVYLQRLLYGNQLTDAELARTAAAEEQEADPVVSELVTLATRVWTGCLQEVADEQQGALPGQHAATRRRLRCNPACLRRRIQELAPGARKQLKAEGWERSFTRKLVEHGVVTYTVPNLRGCLSAVKSAEWSARRCRGVEVPVCRLPAGVEL